MLCSSCYSPVGRTGGSQEVALGDACLNHGTIQHEILHALGLWHEQSRSDRDDFIQVMWDNIQEGKVKAAGQLMCFPACVLKNSRQDRV